MIGDDDLDIQTALNAGCESIRIIDSNFNEYD